mmetsp:Transcript_4831/g.20768  ORF Transcript_4831/g.20768 Transcript_4831/m.20768 type:complete len:119 (+) Transcript_4831:185-541(+)
MDSRQEALSKLLRARARVGTDDLDTALGQDVHMLRTDLLGVVQRCESAGMYAKLEKMARLSQVDNLEQSEDSFQAMVKFMDGMTSEELIKVFLKSQRQSFSDDRAIGESSGLSNVPQR